MGPPLSHLKISLDWYLTRQLETIASPNVHIKLTIAEAITIYQSRDDDGTGLRAGNRREGGKK